MKLTEFFKSKESESAKSVERLRELESHKETRRIPVIIDSRRQDMIRGKAQMAADQERQKLLREIEAINRPIVQKFRESCIKRLRELPSLTSVSEEGKLRHLDGGAEYIVKTNAKVLGELRDAYIEANQQLGSMLASATLGEIEEAIDSWEQKFASFDFAEVETVTVDKLAHDSLVMAARSGENEKAETAWNLGTRIVGEGGKTDSAAAHSDLFAAFDKLKAKVSRA